MKAALALLAGVCAVSGYDGERVMTFPAATGVATVDLKWNWEPPVVHTYVTVNTTANQELMWFSLGYNGVNGMMVGGDYVMGYITPSGETCVRPLSCVGSPPPNSAPKLEISNTHFSAAGAAYTLSFTRPIASGYNPLVAGQPVHMLYATATANPANAPKNCTSDFDFGMVHNFFKSNSTSITFSG
eukprot:TRINITY_DN592_c0_g1_i1.p1 TRINITY_DN592_c0_g1~~TRINITY_DN592_c0_g1_i1.p1  ORF type:complete len:210 (+),score=74.76 TRINITY_DN592_c0_g1_i1:73-630(+)